VRRDSEGKNTKRYRRTILKKNNFRLRRRHRANRRESTCRALRKVIRQTPTPASAARTNKVICSQIPTSVIWRKSVQGRPRLRSVPERKKLSKEEIKSIGRKAYWSSLFLRRYVQEIRRKGREGCDVIAASRSWQQQCVRKAKHATMWHVNSAPLDKQSVSRQKSLSSLSLSLPSNYN
jgi:hypothetical protein